MMPASRRHLMRWYRTHGRHDLPWRRTTDPYAILVSEGMLQQTQVERVLPYYARWLERWPTVETLAAASPADAIREWAGLGYNRRALHLHRAATAVVQRHDGVIPRELPALRGLAGVGPYTASAVASFAFGRRMSVIDTNIARVIARTCLGAARPTDAPQASIAAAAQALLPRRGVRDHNLALMDLGALVCTARNPACEGCPIRTACAWRAAGSPASSRVRSTSPRFDTTARYARGRIIAALCEHDHLTTGSLVALLPGPHRRLLPSHLDALAREGLIAPTASGWSLPT